MILVVAEQRDGKLNRATLETMAAAQAAGWRPTDQGGRARAVRRRRRSGVARPPSAKCCVVEHAALAIYTPDAFTIAVQQVVAHGDADAT